MNTSKRRLHWPQVSLHGKELDHEVSVSLSMAHHLSSRATTRNWEDCTPAVLCKHSVNPWSNNCCRGDFVVLVPKADCNRPESTPRKSSRLTTQKSSQRVGNPDPNKAMIRDPPRTASLYLTPFSLNELFLVVEPFQTLDFPQADGTPASVEFRGSSHSIRKKSTNGAKAPIRE